MCIAYGAILVVNVIKKGLEIQNTFIPGLIMVQDLVYDTLLAF